jgi:hypothetical protein
MMYTLWTMRERIVFSLLLALALLMGSVALLGGETPGVDAVLEKYVNALGGHAILEQINTMTLHGTMEFPQFGTSGTTAEYFKGNHFAALTDVPGYGTVKTIYDGQSGWQVDPQRGTSEIGGGDLEDLQRRADVHWNLKLREYYLGLKMLGKEALGGKDTWKLEATVAGWKYNFWFEADSGLLVRFDSDRGTADGTSSVKIGEYRQVGAVLFAFDTEKTGPPVAWNRKLTDVRFNEPIDDAVFSKVTPNEHPK